MLKVVIAVLIMALATMGASIAIAAVGYASITALGRNPSSAPKIMLAMIVSLIFATAIAVIALLVVFQITAPASG